MLTQLFHNKINQLTPATSTVEDAATLLNLYNELSKNILLILRSYNGGHQDSANIFISEIEAFDVKSLEPAGAVALLLKKTSEFISSLTSPATSMFKMDYRLTFGSSLAANLTEYIDNKSPILEQRYFPYPENVYGSINELATKCDRIKKQLKNIHNNDLLLARHLSLINLIEGVMLESILSNFSFIHPGRPAEITLAFNSFRAKLNAPNHNANLLAFREQNSRNKLSGQNNGLEHKFSGLSIERTSKNPN